MQLDRWAPRVARASFVALVAVGLAACDPPPPRLQLAVDTTLDGADAAPGDGACATSAGTCTLRAALDEADLAPDGADIALPAGSYGGFDATITGDVRINPALQAGVIIPGGTFTVAAGGHLEAHGINTATADILGEAVLHLVVAGTANVTRSVISGVEVDAGGTVALTDSVVAGPFGGTVRNDGTLLAVRSTLLGHGGDGVVTNIVLRAGTGAVTHLVASAIAQPRLDSDEGFALAGGGGTCDGATPTVASYTVAEIAAPCGAVGPDVAAEVEYLAETATGQQTGFELSVESTSPLVDAIPLGDPACDTSTADLFGTPRGVDGDGDGVGGCDVGAIERPTTTVTPLLLGGPGNAFGGPGTGVWAHVNGPGMDAANGDSVNTRCLTERNTNPCTIGANPGFGSPADPNRGTWYVIDAPAAGGSVTVSIHDAQLTIGQINLGSGDSTFAGGSGAAFTTTYRMYQQHNPHDFNTRTPLGSFPGDATPGSCHWSIQGSASFDDAWTPLCTITTAPGARYLLNVQSVERSGFPDSAARNGFAVRACTNDVCTGSGQPTVRALGPTVLHTLTDTGAATAYLAEVGPQHAGSTLVVELWDPGESAGTVHLLPRMPSATQPGAVQTVPAAACDLTSSRPGYPLASHVGATTCSVRTTVGGIPIYNGHAVTLRVEIPADYTCSLGVDPVTSAGSCWWGISYSATAGIADTTTWRAHIETTPPPG